MPRSWLPPHQRTTHHLNLPATLNSVPHSKRHLPPSHAQSCSLAGISVLLQRLRTQAILKPARCAPQSQHRSLSSRHFASSSSAYQSASCPRASASKRLSAKRVTGRKRSRRGNLRRWSTSGDLMKGRCRNFSGRAQASASVSQMMACCLSLRRREEEEEGNRVRRNGNLRTFSKT